MYYNKTYHSNTHYQVHKTSTICSRSLGQDQGQATSDGHGHLVNATASEPP